MFKLMAGRAAAMHFVEVDGVLVKQNVLTAHTRKLDVAPGLRKMTLGVQSGSLELSTGQFAIELEAKPGAYYVFAADVVGMDYDLSIWDMTAGEDAKSLVKKDRTAIRQKTRIQVTPIGAPK